MNGKKKKGPQKGGTVFAPQKENSHSAIRNYNAQQSTDRKQQKAVPQILYIIYIFVRDHRTLPATID